MNHFYNVAGHLSSTKVRVVTCSICGHTFETKHRTKQFHKDCVRKRNSERVLAKRKEQAIMKA